VRVGSSSALFVSPHRIPSCLITDLPSTAPLCLATCAPASVVSQSGKSCDRNGSVPAWVDVGLCTGVSDSKRVLHAWEPFAPVRYESGMHGTSTT
jgi:hypothetical protein